MDINSNYPYRAAGCALQEPQFKIVDRSENNTPMISIVIPAYNEEALLQKSIDRLAEYLSYKTFAFEVLVVDNGSTDLTGKIAKELEKTYAWFRFFQIPEKSVGKAFAMGVRQSKYPYIVSLDADLSVDLVFIDYAASLLKFSSMLVGSKTMGKQRRSFLRIFGSQFYLFITQVFFQTTLTDFSMGAKAYQKDTITPVLSHIDNWTAYVFEICIWLLRNKKEVIQIGIECEDLRKSRFNIWYEGFYRFWNLYRVFKELNQPNSWLNQIKTP